MNRCIPPTALAVRLLELAKADPRPSRQILKDAGLSLDVLKHWGQGSVPSLSTAAVVAGALGYRITVVPIPEAGVSLPCPHCYGTGKIKIGEQDG